MAILEDRKKCLGELGPAGNRSAELTLLMEKHKGATGVDNVLNVSVDGPHAPVQVGGIPIDESYVLRHGYLGFARDVTDVVDSAPIMLALLKYGVPGEGYNVGSGQAYTIQTLMDAVLQFSKAPVIKVFDKSRLRAADEKILVADIEKVRNLTGWTPSPDISKTAEAILNWWRDEIRLRY